MEDLDDDMLTQILLRLPNCKTVVACSPYYNHTKDYKFRVVEVCHPCMDHSLESLDIFDLVVYCSEIGEWKEIKLRVPQEAAGLLRVTRSGPENVVCNGIIYFKIGLCLVALDPFDVNDTCNTTLEVRVMPPLPDFGYLLESSGQLLLVHNPYIHRKDGTTVKLHMVVWKLDLNQAHLVWETIFQGFCKGTVNNIEFPGIGSSISASDIVVHPYNDKLIYMYLAYEKQLVLCDTQIGCITSLKRLSEYVWRFHKLEQKWWPPQFLDNASQ